MVRQGVLEHVVQQAHRHADLVEAQLGQQVGDVQRVGDVGLATAPELAVVGLFGEVVGASYVVGLLRVEVTAKGGVEGINGLHC